MKTPKVSFCLNCQAAARVEKKHTSIMEFSMLKFLASTAGIIFLVGLVVIIGLLMLIF
ncbi:MAG TPA: hypothetical protein IAA18_06365 [Candidatus Pseudomonas excrementavium]|uniref:hypothetical protein n=1 Tax=Halopseudomonas bauzanensis TaxID=653930 RepID=UPI001C3A881B|nr:hypothetical protein [Halopseudomonas bauzanensis]HIZ50691.1 hypothetical protein [Candidatus Pseudomonas excrementavium]